MQVGDLVKVKDAHGYNSYMQEFVGHIGIIMVFAIGSWAQVHILGKTRPVLKRDLEVIK